MSTFIDSNVIIKAFVDDKDSERCTEILQGDFITDTVCLVEAQHGISVIKNDKSYAADCIKSLFKGSGIIMQLDKGLLFESFKSFDDLEIKRFEP